MKGIGSFHFSMRMIGVPCRAFIVAIACFASLSVARAEVLVSGSRDAVTVQAENALLSDIIAAVNSTLHIKINVVPAINIPITGTYSGPLRRVFARMLAGHDFVLNSSGDRMTIILATQASPGPGSAAAGKNRSNSRPGKRRGSRRRGKHVRGRRLGWRIFVKTAEIDLCEV